MTIKLFENEKEFQDLIKSNWDEAFAWLREFEAKKAKEECQNVEEVSK